MTAPPAMIATCEIGSVQASATAAPATATTFRGQSGASDAVSAQTAWATTATAASFRPWTQPAVDRSVEAVSNARTTNATADGSVNPSHEATPPSGPARDVPIAMPSWLLAGPGSDWLNARYSANSASSSHRRRST